MKNIWIFVAILLLVACNKNNKTNENSAGESDSVSIDSSTHQVETLTLQTFEIPPEVMGCSCNFAVSKAEFDAGHYIYVDDYGNKAYLKIEDQLVEIPMEEGDFDPSHFEKSIENENYKVEMKGKSTSEMEEVLRFEGEMTVENKTTHQKITTPFYGECGC